MLDAVELTEKADARVRTLSGGQQRRVDLALGLIGDPDLLFLDEPTTGFDPTARRRSWDLVRNLTAGGKTVVLTTHYLEEAQEMCDQIAIIHEGALRALDTTANLLSKLDTKTLVVETETAAEISLPAGVTQSQRADGTLAFTYSRSAISPGEILDSLRLAGVKILDIQTEQPDLQDVLRWHQLPLVLGNRGLQT